MRKILLRLLSVVFSCLLCNASAMADEILHYTSDTLGVQAERGAAAGQYELRLSSPGSAESDFKVFALEDPARLVIDVTGSKHSKQQKVVAESNSLIKSMRTGKHPDKLRVVFDLAGSKVPDYSTSFAKGVMNVHWGAVIGQVASKPQERTKKPQAVKPLTVAKVAAPVSKNQSRQPVKKQLAKKVRITHQGKQAATPKSNWVTEKVERERLIKSDGRSNWVTKPVPAADKVRADRNHRLIVTNQGLVRKRREQKERSDPGTESHSVEKVSVDIPFLNFESGGSSSENVRVSNQEAHAVTLAVRVERVIDPGKLSEAYTTTSDVLVLPNQVRIEAGRQDAVQLKLASGLSQKERVYRVQFISPDGKSSEKLSLLVFARPVNPRVKLSWERSGDAILFRNEGNTNVHLAHGKLCKSGRAACAGVRDRLIYPGTETKMQVPQGATVEFVQRAGSDFKLIRVS